MAEKCRLQKGCDSLLGLKSITKNYLAGDSEVQALKGIDIMFRQNEFVAVLGPSGCGKTTLLNIVGGLDRYTSGDLVIAGKSTKEYKDKDWDHYRNHTIGFVFQTYNLIPHQTVLANVELALTLSGISKAERRERAKKMLEKVCLGDQLHKRPNQMSGGQMQRVAIARALINDPEILLADEPTGALDTETSVQIMDLLKEIAKDRLVIMVTHNPELAEEYATRIIRLLDGKVQSDSMPYSEKDEAAERKASAAEEGRKKKEKRVSMSSTTAFSLSLNNLMTKKARTLLTSFAGSIGIIGISLILSLSDGFQTFINTVQENTLSSYPLTILSRSVDLTSVIENVTGQAEKEVTHPLDKVYSSGQGAAMINAMVSEVKQNDMEGFKKYIEAHADELADYNIEYDYNIQPVVYLADTADKITPVNPNPLVDAYYSMLGYDMNGMSSSYSQMMQMSTDGMDVWTLLYGDRELLESQYDVISGHWPENMNEVILVVDEHNEINGMTLYGLGLRDPDEISDLASKIMGGEKIEEEDVDFSYDELMNMQFRMLASTDCYEYSEAEKCWKDRSRDDEYMAEKIENGIPVHISGIVRRKAGAVTGALMPGTVCYTQELIDKLMELNADSKIVREQQARPEIDVFTGYEFENHDDVTMDDIYDYIDNMSEQEFATLQVMFSNFYGTSFDGKDVVDALNAMSDDELVEAVKPAMLEGLTAKDARDFAATTEGNAALTMVLNAAEGSTPVSDKDPLADLETDELFQLYYQLVDTQMTADTVREQLGKLSDHEIRNAFMPFVLDSLTADDVRTFMATEEGAGAMMMALADAYGVEPSPALLENPDADVMLDLYRGMVESQLTAEDIRSRLESVPDDTLLTAAKPAILKSLTPADARTFAKTDEGKMALGMMLAAQNGEAPADNNENRITPDDVDDAKLLEAYKSLVGSQLTAEAIRKNIADMSEEEQEALAQSFNPAKDIDSLKSALATMDEDMLLSIFKEQILAQSTDNTYEGNLQKLGLREENSPFAIQIYSPSFSAKEDFGAFVDRYNDSVKDEDGKIEYTDYIGLLLSSVTKIINMVSYVLIGFVSISLVVSSIMIGIITYISVLERTKEIGILRSIGASKHDVSRVFNAETFIVGLVAGVIGVVITMLLDIPINMIIEHASGQPDIAFLRPVYALILIGISVLLTLIAGIIPARLAAKKDPVIALRTE